MDPLDVRILRTYYHDPSLSPLISDFRVSMAALARKLGEDEDTVRHRLEMILHSGFLADTHLMVNPRVWGGGHAVIWFDIDAVAPKRDLVEALRLVPGMTHVAVFYDRIAASLEFDDEESLPRQAELVRRLARAPDVYVTRTAFSAVEFALSAKDWDLIRVLRRDPRMSYTELAGQAGVTSRTARDRLARIIKAGAVFAWPSPNFRVLRDTVPACLLLRYPVGLKSQVDQEVAAHLEPYLWHVVHLGPYRPGDLCPCGYDLMLPNLSVSRRVLDWVSDVAGVESARMHLYDEVISFFDSYDERLDGRIRQMPTALPIVRTRESLASAPRAHHS